MGKYKPWTTGEIRRLRKGWENAEFYDVIAADLGRTKSSVLGQLHRIGLFGLVAFGQGRSFPSTQSVRGKGILASLVRPKRARGPRKRPSAPASAKEPSKPADDVGVAAGALAAVKADVEAAEATCGSFSLSPAALAVDALTATNCHWPIGAVLSEGFHFCGKPRERGPYCAHHAAMAFDPVRSGKRLDGGSRAA